MQFALTKYFNTHENYTMNLLILIIRQIKQFSSENVETWCFFSSISMSKLHSMLIDTSRGNAAGFTILPSFLCMNSGFIHPLTFSLTAAYAQSTSMAHPCWSLYRNRTFLTMQHYVSVTKGKVRWTLLRNGLSIAHIASGIHKTSVWI